MKINPLIKRVTAERVASKVTIHPGYDMTDKLDTRRDDLAILELEEPVRLSESIRPICLPGGEKDNLEKVKGLVLGFGHVDDQGTFARKLKKAVVEITSNRDCKEKFQKRGLQRMSENIFETNLCAGGQGKEGSCPGDSGGPLNCKIKGQNKYELCGMVSWGIPELCSIDGALYGEIPDVYIRVTKYLEWIQDNTEGSSFVPTELGATVKLPCQSATNEDFTACRFLDPQGNDYLHPISRRKRNAMFEGMSVEFELLDCIFYGVLVLDTSLRLMLPP